MHVTIRDMTAEMLTDDVVLYIATGVVWLPHPFMTDVAPPLVHRSFHNFGVLAHVGISMGRVMGNFTGTDASHSQHVAHLRVISPVTASPDRYVPA